MLARPLLDTPPDICYPISTIIPRGLPRNNGEQQLTAVAIGPTGTAMPPIFEKAAFEIGVGGIVLRESAGMKVSELRRTEELAVEHRLEIERRWHERFG